MNIPNFMMVRHQQLHTEVLANLKNTLSEEQLKFRPLEGMQPIIWLVWHMARVEDMGLSRFIWRTHQLYDASWRARMNLQIDHYGTSMREEEVANFVKTVEVDGVLAYQTAVGQRTKEMLEKLDVDTLDEVLSEEEVLRVVRDEGMASEDAQWVSPHYIGKTRGWMLCHMGLTHNFRHFGQIALVRKIIKLRENT